MANERIDIEGVREGDREKVKPGTRDRQLQARDIPQNAKKT